MKKNCFVILLLFSLAGMRVFSAPTGARANKGYVHYVVARERAVGKMSLPALSPKVLWRGTITFKVASFTDARKQALDIARKYGGTSYGERVNVASNGRKSGSIMLGVPVENRGDFIRDLQSLGKLYSERLSAPDLTGNYVDLQNRTKDLRAEESQLLRILARARNVLEVLQIQQHLFAIRIAIEEMMSRSSQIAVDSRNALFTLDFFEAPPVTRPVEAEGAARFIPNWCAYTAVPVIKSRLGETFDSVAGGMLRKALGSAEGIPNILWLVLFAVGLSIFYKTAWPNLRQFAFNLAGQLLDHRVPFSSALAGMAAVYFSSLFLPRLAMEALIFVLLLGLWNLFCRSEKGISLTKRFVRDETAAAAVRHGVNVLLGIGLFQLLLPGLMEDFEQGLFHALLLVLFLAAIVAGIGSGATAVLMAKEKLKARFLRSQDEI